MTFGIAASTFAPVLLLTVWWPRLTRAGVVAGFLVGLVVSLAFTFARFAGLGDLLGIPVLGNPALYSVPAAFTAAVVASLATHDVGSVDHFMALARGHEALVGRRRPAGSSIHDLKAAPLRRLTSAGHRRHGGSRLAYPSGCEGGCRPGDPTFVREQPKEKPCTRPRPCDEPARASGSTTSRATC
jgi:hypothetical protein